MITSFSCMLIFVMALLSFKDSIIFCCYFHMDKFSLMLAMVYPFFLLFMNKFNSNSMSGSIYSLAFIMVLLLFFFCCQNHYFLILLLEFSALIMVFSVFDLSKSWDKSSSLIFMFLINMMGSVLFMIFCGLNSKIIPNFSYYSSMDFNNSFFLSFCCFVLLLSKVPLFLLHFWLTKAHVSAHSTCSMLLASLMIKLGTMGFFKFCSFNLFISSKFFTFFTSFCLISCVFIGFTMFRFFDIKLLVACSSILHMSMLIPMMMFTDFFSLSSSFFMNLSHGLVSCYLFFLVSIGYEMNQSRSLSTNKSYNSFNYFFTLIFMFTIFFNLGLPPFISFLSELLLSFFLLSISFFSLFFFCLIMLFSVFFSIFMILNITFGKKNFAPYLELDIFSHWIFFFFLFLMTISPFLLNYSCK